MCVESRRLLKCQSENDRCAKHKRSDFEDENFHFINEKTHFYVTWLWERRDATIDD